MPLGRKGKRRSKKVVKAEKEEDREPRRASVDSILGRKLREAPDVIPEPSRESFDVALKTPERAGKLPPLQKQPEPVAESSSEEEIEYFDGNGAKTGGAADSPKKVEAVEKVETVKEAVKEAVGSGPSRSTPKPGKRRSVDKAIFQKSPKPGRGAGEGGDDEFDYAFEGKPRDGKTHKREFVAKEAPQNLFMSRQNNAGVILEEEVEEAAEDKSRQTREKSIEMTTEQWSAIIDIQYEDDETKEVYTFEETLIYEEAVAALQPELNAAYETVDDYELSCCLTWNSWFKNKFSKPEFVTKEKRCLVLLSETEFEKQDARHESILASIYCAIFGEDPANVKRFGKHWEQIGFQDHNPTTDLRGTGMLGLVQILFFVENCFNMTKVIFDYSQNAHYGFPFCAVALNISGLGLDLLKEGCFDEPAIDVGGLHTAFMMWYCGALNVFFRTWKDARCTMEEAGHVMDILRTQMLSKATIRRVMMEGSVVSESYIPKDDDEMEMEMEMGEGEEVDVEFDRI